MDLIADKVSPSVCYVVFEDNEINKFDDLELKQEINVPFTPAAGDINYKGDVLAIGDTVYINIILIFLICFLKQEGFVHLLNASTGETLSKLQNFSSRITCVKFSSDDRLLAVGESAFKLKLWDVQKKEVKIHSK